MENKKPWQSKTIIYNFVLALMGALVMMFPQLSVVQDFLKNHVAEISMGLGVLGMVLRFITKGAVSLGD